MTTRTDDNLPLFLGLPHDAGPDAVAEALGDRVHNLSLPSCDDWDEIDPDDDGADALLEARRHLGARVVAQASIEMAEFRCDYVGNTQAYSTPNLCEVEEFDDGTAIAFVDGDASHDDVVFVVGGLEAGIAEQLDDLEMPGTEISAEEFDPLPSAGLRRHVLTVQCDAGAKQLTYVVAEDVLDGLGKGGGS